MPTSESLATRLGFPILACALGLALAFHPTLCSRFRRMQADSGDTRLNNYVLEHSWRWVSRAPGHDELWNPRVLYPTQNVAAYSEVLLGAAPIYWALRAGGLAPDTAFQAWMIAVGALNFLAAHGLFRRGFGRSPAAAAAGAFLFSFGSARVCHLLHQQLWPQFYTVLAVLAVVRIMENGPEARTRRWIAVFFASVVLQIYASFYGGWFLGFALGLAFLAALLFRDPRRAIAGVLARHWAAVGTGALLAALAIAPLARHWLAAAAVGGFRRFDEVLPMLPRPQAWVYMGPESWLYGWMTWLPAFRDLPQEAEDRVGLGVLTAAIATLGLFRERRRRAVQVLVLASAAIVLLTTVLPWGEITAWKAVYLLVPGAKALRGVARIGALLLLPAGLGLAFWLDRAREARRFALAATVAALSALEQGQAAPSFDKLYVRARVAALARAVDPRCQAFLFAPLTRPPPTEDELNSRLGASPELILPTLAWPWWDDQVDAMWAHLATGVPTLNGYYGRFPPGWRLITIGAPEYDQELERWLARWEKANGLDPARICWIKRAPEPAPP